MPVAQLQRENYLCRRQSTNSTPTTPPQEIIEAKLDSNAKEIITLKDNLAELQGAHARLEREASRLRMQEVRPSIFVSCLRVFWCRAYL